MNKISVTDRLKHISGDFLLNILASLIATGTLQLLVYPFLARMLGADANGRLLTLMGIANTLQATVGISINNARLMVNSSYEMDKKSGDFLPILFIGGVIAVIVFYVMATVIYKLNTVIAVLLCAYIFLSSLTNYGSVAFRIVINYKKNLIFNVYKALGNCGGLLLIFALSASDMLWPLPFVLGEAVSLIYICLTSNIFKDSFNFTKNFKKTMTTVIVLVVTTLSGNLLVYLDRLILLPIIGGKAVTVYTVASIFGKSLGILMTPLAGVLLSYYFQKDFEMTRRLYWKINIVFFAVTGAFTLVSFVFGKCFTAILYPGVIDEASKYLLIANFTAILGVLSSLIQPSVLKASSVAWQLIIQGLYGVFYLGCGIIGSRNAGLDGFVWAALLAMIVKNLVLILIGDHSLYTRDRKLR